jgi:hypothetical protein
MPLRAPSFLAVSLALAGCSDAPFGQEHLGAARGGIVNGSLDTAHPAVVAHFGAGCSATIVEVDLATGKGWALTAAHCIGGSLPGVIAQGADYNNPDVVYTAEDVEVHPEYAASKLYDFAVVRFKGATAATPVLPLLTPAMDSLAPGTQLDIVGYGATPGGNSKRRHVVKPISKLTDLRIIYDQSASGMCFGDSGGGSLATVSNAERVAGVHQAVSDQSCVGAGLTSADGRVTAVHDTFIRPAIDGTPYKAQSCDQCREAHTAGGDCAGKVKTCFADAGCEAYYDCIVVCTNYACVNKCKQTHPAGYQLYQQINDCVCQTGCASECAGDASCKPPPACGIDWVDDGCQACADQACCAESNACAVDVACLGCVAQPLQASCFGHPPFEALKSCVAAVCPACGLTQSSSATSGVTASVGSTSATSGAGGDTTTVGPASVGATVSAGVGGAAAAPDDEPVVIEEACACALPGARSRSDRGVVLLALVALGALASRVLRPRPRS